jgi:hypothetical protein
MLGLIYTCVLYRRRCSQLVLLMLVMGIPLPMHAASDTATITANIVTAISLTNRSGLVFGDISSSNVAGTVVLSPAGSRISTGGADIDSTVASGPAAVFDVVGLPNAVYAITLPLPVVLIGPGGNNMVVDNFTSLPTTTGLTDAGGQQNLFIGATLNVGRNQSFGSYTGIMFVIVAYN